MMTLVFRSNFSQLQLISNLSPEGGSEFNSICVVEEMMFSYICKKTLLFMFCRG